MARLTMNHPEPEANSGTPIIRFGGTAVYVNNVRAALDSYDRACGIKTRFFDEALQYGELETGSSLIAFASHQLFLRSILSWVTAQFMPPDLRRHHSVIETALLAPTPARLQNSRNRTLSRGFRLERLYFQNHENQIFDPEIEPQNFSPFRADRGNCALVCVRPCAGCRREDSTIE